MIWQTSSTGSADTERLGELLGRQLKGGEVIELRSDLGGGKTTFVKGLARGAGSQGSVTSPTFTLNRQYQAENFQISHFDFYRLQEPGIMSEQLAEAIRDGQVIVVEWADVVEDVLPEERLTVEIAPTANRPDERKITFIYSQEYIEQIAAVETAWPEVEP